MYYLLGEMGVRGNSSTNLRIPWKNKIGYYNARSVVFFSQMVPRTTYKVYAGRAARKKGIHQISMGIASVISLLNFSFELC